MADSIHTSKAQNKGKKRNTRVMLARMPAPYRLKVPFEVYRGRHTFTVGRSWIIDCPDRQSMVYVKTQLDALMRSLDGVIITEPISE